MDFIILLCWLAWDAGTGRMCNGAFSSFYKKTQKVKTKFLFLMPNKPIEVNMVRSTPSQAHSILCIENDKKKKLYQTIS